MPPVKREEEVRVPSRNVSSAVSFILRGSEKRRAMATTKAQQLQRELGVIPRLSGVK